MTQVFDDPGEFENLRIAELAASRSLDSFVRGTVQSSASRTVRLDTDTSVDTPVSLALCPLRDGKRVWCQWHGTQLVVVGVIQSLSDTDWQVISPQGGWSIPGGQVARYRRRNGMVECEGWLVNATVAGGSLDLAFILPAGFRPGSLQGFPITSNTTTVFTAQAATNGNVTIYSGATSSAWRPLNAIRFEQVN